MHSPLCRTVSPSASQTLTIRMSGFEVEGFAEKRKKPPYWVAFSFVERLRKRYFFQFAIRIRTQVKYKAFRPKGEKLHQHLFTIHYYLLLAKKRQEVLVKSEE